MRDVAERLMKSGLRVWFDKWDIRPGGSIQFGSDRAQLESGTFEMPVNHALRDPLNKERRFLSLPTFSVLNRPRRREGGCETANA